VWKSQVCNNVVFTSVMRCYSLERNIRKVEVSKKREVKEPKYRNVK